MDKSKINPRGRGICERMSCVYEVRLRFELSYSYVAGDSY